MRVNVTMPARHSISFGLYSYEYVDEQVGQVSGTLLVRRVFPVSEDVRGSTLAEVSQHNVKYLWGVMVQFAGETGMFCTRLAPASTLSVQLAPSS